MTGIDPIQLELMRHLFESVAEEMGIVLQRCSFSANIKERRDFSCAIFDADGQLLAQAAHIPVHLGSMPQSVAACLKKLGPLGEGDTAIVNDPFDGGTHLPDITMVSPIFKRGELIGYAANRAHHANVGGDSPGSMPMSRHIDEEGIRIEPTLLRRNGIRDDDFFFGLVKRIGDTGQVEGDLDAQLAANLTGGRAILRMAEAYGISTMQAYGRALLEYSATFMQRLIESLPAGQARFEDVLDDPTSRIVANVCLDGESVVVDLRESSDQTDDCLNCPRAVTESAVYYCFACLLDEQVPLNAGCFRNIEVLTRPGSLVHALYPAAVAAGNTETSQRIVDVVFGALAQLLPDRIPAASCGSMSSLAMGGERWSYYETVGGGCGAGPNWDGESAVQCHMTNTLNTPAEAIEMQYPLRVRRFERVLDSGGAGRFRGGDGIIREIEITGHMPGTMLAIASGTILSTRRASCPYGLAGGEKGRAGGNWIIRADGHEESLPGMTKFELIAGDVIRIVTPGGGGWGKSST